MTAARSAGVPARARSPYAGPSRGSCDPPSRRGEARSDGRGGGTTILVTNLPRRQNDADNVRNGTTAETVLRLYLDQYNIEHTYRFMKSGLGIDRVFLHKPSRKNAMMFVIDIATLICDIIDAMSRRRSDGSIRTFRTVTEELVDAQIRYDRGTDSMDVEGPPVRADQLTSIMAMMGVDPQLLLGFTVAA